MSYNISVFPIEIKKSVFFQILLPNSKPVTVKTIYHPPNQYNFVEVPNEDTNKTESISNEIDILGWFDINLSLNDSSIFSKKKKQTNIKQKSNQFQVTSKVTINYVIFLVGIN